MARVRLTAAAAAIVAKVETWNDEAAKAHRKHAKLAKQVGAAREHLERIEQEWDDFQSDEAGRLDALSTELHGGLEALINLRAGDESLENPQREKLSEVLSSLDNSWDWDRELSEVRIKPARVASLLSALDQRGRRTANRGIESRGARSAKRKTKPLARKPRSRVKRRK